MSATIDNPSVTAPHIGALARAAVVAAVASVVVVLVIGTIAHALGASDDFRPLHPAAYVPFTVVGVVVGSLVWFLVVRRAQHSRRLLSRVVPIVMALTLVPDLLVGISGSQAGTSWGAVIALMLMHLGIAAVSVPVLQRFLPAR